MNNLTKGMVVNILALEDNSARFERFCVELFSKLDGTDYVTTSATWDLGRDGRQASLFGVEVFPVLCISLNDKVPGKAKKDLGRLLSTTELSGIRFCSSQALSEHIRDKIRLELRGIAPPVETVEVEGSEQIETIIRRHRSYSSLFERFYQGEIAEHCAFLASRDDEDDNKVSGMRIALSTQLTNDGEALRNDLLHNLVLTALADGRRRTQTGIAKLLSDSLFLGRIVNEGYITSALSELESEHFVKRDANLFIITEEGRRAAADRAGSGAEMLGEGQRLLREAIMLLSGQTLPEREFLEVWRIVKEELSELLYLNGMQTIGALAS